MTRDIAVTWWPNSIGLGGGQTGRDRAGNTYLRLPSGCVECTPLDGDRGYGMTARDAKADAVKNGGKVR